MLCGALRIMNKKYIKLFDFEVGHLIKSPCKDCSNYVIFPRCIAECTLLDNIQDVLSTMVSNSR